MTASTPHPRCPSPGDHGPDDNACMCLVLEAQDRLRPKVCRHCGHQIWENPKGSPSERWTDNRSDTAFLGSGFVCPVNMRHEPEET